MYSQENNIGFSVKKIQTIHHFIVIDARRFACRQSCFVQRSLTLTRLTLTFVSSPRDQFVVEPLVGVSSFATESEKQRRVDSTCRKRETEKQLATRTQPIPVNNNGDPPNRKVHDTSGRLLLGHDLSEGFFTFKFVGARKRFVCSPKIRAVRIDRRLRWRTLLKI